MKYIQTLLFGFLITLTSTASAVVWFSDTDQVSVWARDAVEVTTDRGIFKGYPDGTIRPKNPVNRAELLTLIARTKNLSFPDASTMASPFVDIPRNAWYRNSVIYAAEQGWIEGYEDGTFGGEKNINWAEFTVLMSRAFGIPSDQAMGYNDVQDTDWFYGSVGAFQQGRLTRKLQGSFYPAHEVTREEVAYTLMRLLEKPSTSAVSATQEDSVDLYRTAYRPRTNLRIEGYDTEKSAFYVELADYSTMDPLSIDIGDDWLHTGDILIINKTGYSGELNTLELRILLEESNAGPVDSFMAKIVEAETGDEYTQDFNRSGVVFWSGLQLSMRDTQTHTFQVYIKPKTDVSFLETNSDILFYVSDIQGFMHRPEQRYIGAPVEFIHRNLMPLRFMPQDEIYNETITEVQQNSLPPLNSTTRAAYGQWSLRNDYEGHTDYNRSDCVGLHEGKTHGKDVLSTLIVDAGVFRDLRKEAYTPEYVYAVEQSIQQYITENEEGNNKLYTNYVCHLSPAIDVVAGYLHPNYRDVDQYEEQEGLAQAPHRLYIVTPQEVYDFSTVESLLNTVTTGDNHYPCTAEYISESNSVRWQCIDNMAYDTTGVIHTTYNEYIFTITTEEITQETNTTSGE